MGKTTTNKEACNILVDVLVQHGVKHVVLSPGSRNAPLIVAFTRTEGIDAKVIVDERSAAFVALGMAQQTGEPVALVCTSGTALLNYSPAVAEAYYQKLPLIVVSADRPKEWIDQDDSQTIRQFEALSQFVKRSYDIPSRCDDDTARWYVNRICNEAMMQALNGRRAPVHINVQLGEPLASLGEWSKKTRCIEMTMPSPKLEESEIIRLATSLRHRKVLIIAGFMQPNKQLETALAELEQSPNVVVMTETIANMPHNRFIRAIDRTLLAMGDKQAKYRPDVLITIGGAIVSRKIKTFLRQYSPKEHWYVGINDVTVDCMQCLTRHIQTNPETFFTQLNDYYVAGYDTGYACKMWQLDIIGEQKLLFYTEEIGWSDMLAMDYIFSALNHEDISLQLSNGTVIRYAQLFGDRISVPNFCNRGVSGIDGSTSTALGASLVRGGTTILITGDMSFMYDLSGLASMYNSKKFKIIVLCNGGGGIFRFVKGTASLPELDDYFVVDRQVNVKGYAAAFGFEYLEADSVKSLQNILATFLKMQSPVILSVKTDGKISGEILTNYLK